MFGKIIKWIAGIFFLIEFIGFLIMLCTNYKTQFFPWLFGTILFGMLTYICFKKPKKKQIKESNTIEKINYSTQFPTETLQDIKKYYPKQNIPVLISQIKESLYLVETTTNIETLLSRKEDGLKKCFTLKELENCGLYKNKPSADEFINRYNKNFNNHIKRCYDDYFSKAHQLKTESGIQKRMDKFWSILNEYLDEFTIKDFKDTL